jgi:hypothetical protein
MHLIIFIAYRRSEIETKDVRCAFEVARLQPMTDTAKQITPMMAQYQWVTLFSAFTIGKR